MLTLRRPRPPMFAFFVALFMLQAATCAAERLVVVVSGDTTRFRQALTGIRSAGVTVDAVDAAAEDAARAAVAGIGRDGAIVTLGANATALVARAAPAAPVVNCMVAGGDSGTPAPGTIVVPLEVPIEAHIQWLRRLVPEARRVGILFDPERNERRAADDAARFRREGYAPVLAPVIGPTGLRNALTRLIDRVDVLFAIPDPVVFAREHSRALLLFSFRQHVPLAGPSESWVRGGALYAVDWDYQDLGRYCATLALRQRAGTRKAIPMPMPAPARTRVVVNARSAEQFNLRWDAELLGSVDRVPE
ncbi:MAG: ABC transporter substrate binding protein [Betaproteobacteria bacterium]